LEYYKAYKTSIITETGISHKGVEISRNIKIIQETNRVETMWSWLTKTLNNYGSIPKERNRESIKVLDISIGYVGLTKTNNKHISTFKERQYTILIYSYFKGYIKDSKQAQIKRGLMAIFNTLITNSGAILLTQP